MPKAWRASWLAPPEISRLEVAGLRVRGCQGMVLADVGPGSGIVGSEWLQKCRASHLRVAREVWLPAHPVHPVFVSGNRVPLQMYGWEDGQGPGKGGERVQPCRCSAFPAVTTCSTSPKAGIGRCCPGLAQSLQKPEVKSSCMFERSSLGGGWEKGDASQLLSQLQRTLLPVKYPFTAAVAETKHINTGQHCSTTAASIQPAPSPGTALKRELEAGGVLDGVSSVPLWMLWAGSACSGWGRLCACQGCSW